jgi:uncharacterized protein YgbK (DUF1537 family)
MNHLLFSDIQKKYPNIDSENLRLEIADFLRENYIKIVVLDDDPTGIQTVHGCYLLTNWREENLRAAFADEQPFFYLLTNTRAMTAQQAEQTLREAMRAVLKANEAQKFRLIFVSRSDSTLRGHFPLEPEIMREEAEKSGGKISLPTFFIPTFFEAGRYTVEGVHYMREGEKLTPVAETEFARDNVFGYTQSNLTEYICEKSQGKISPAQVGNISIDALRNRNVERALTENFGKKYVAVDAFDYSDLRKFSLALLRTFCESGNTAAVLRTSSSLPKALSGIADIPLLNTKIISGKKGAGIFIVGSHVKKSTTQLSALLAAQNVAGVEVDVDEILRAPEVLLKKTEEQLLALFQKNITPVVYTSRTERRSADLALRQLNGQKISEFLVEIVRNLPFQPAYLVAKGGITSHDILTKGLEIERARVLGQILSGVPAVRTAADNRFPGMPYIIFPGNVGSEEALKEVLEKLQG